MEPKQKYKIQEYSGKTLPSGVQVVGLDRQSSKNNIWIFKCKCGKTFSALSYSVLSGKKKSCGCLRNRDYSKSLRHNMSNNRFYHSWVAIMQRCYNENDSHYKRYGARGIYVCDDWKDPIFFIKWAESTHPSGKGFSVDRVDNDGPYAPWNCRWATPKQQSQNRRTNTIIEMDGESKSIAEWCDIYKTKYSSVLARIQHGWNPEEAIKTPIGKVGTNQFSNIHITPILIQDSEQHSQEPQEPKLNL